MFRGISIACLALFLFIRPGAIALGSDASTRLQLTVPAPGSVGLYGKYEATFQLDQVVENPFNADEIDVNCVFVAPSGRESRVPGFICDRQAGIWKLRYTPRELGRYQGTIMARGKGWQEELSLLPFDVTESGSKGFVHCTAEKPGRLQFETGKMFLPVSMVLWGSFLSANAVELSQLQPGGINHVRLISNESCFGGAYNIERTGLPLGEYDLDRAKHLDGLFERLDALDMYVTFNFLLNTDFQVTDPWPGFSANPYNATNGGPCKVPSDVFTNPDARRLFRQRLRYTLARWGYSTRLSMWELWAEADVCEGFDRHVEAARDWHQEMLEGENFIGLHPMEVETLRYSTLPQEPVFGDFELPTPDEEVAWGPPAAGTTQEANGVHVIRIPNDGQSPEASIPRILPPNRPVAFDVEYAADGEFVFAGWWLPDTGIAKIRARLDDKEVLHVDLPGVGWEGRLGNSYQEHLGVPCAFPVPRGHHRILLENTGNAWVTMSVDLCDYQRPDRPNLRVYGLANQTRACIWITNRDNTWWRNRMGKTPRDAYDVTAIIGGFQPGNYAVEWWDTYAGVVSRRESVTVDANGTLELRIPEVARDVACKIRPTAQQLKRP